MSHQSCRISDLVFPLALLMLVSFSKLGNTVAKLRQVGAKSANQTGTRSRHRIAAGRIEDERAVVSRLTGALLRAFLVVFLILTPSLMLPTTHADTTQVAALVALIAGMFTFVEYNSEYPSLIEFRDAPPFNRIRFFALFGTVFALSLVLRGQVAPTTLSLFLEEIATIIAQVIDVPYSPVRLMVLMLPEDASPALVSAVRNAAGLTYLVSILSLAVFVLYIRLASWPKQTGGFNVWINMPTFDPTAGGDVVERLSRDSQINLIFGFLIPFLIPAIVKLAADLVNPISLADPHTLIWTMTLWAFLPSTLLMRGIALARVAQLISDRRRKEFEHMDEELQPA